MGWIDNLESRAGSAQLTVGDFIWGFMNGPLGLAGVTLSEVAEAAPNSTIGEARQSVGDIADSIEGQTGTLSDTARKAADAVQWIAIGFVILGGVVALALLVGLAFYVKSVIKEGGSVVKDVVKAVPK